MQFKKTLFTALALLSTILFVPQAQAIPAFARQVGMACTACHYQHFPVLNSFGRAFKENGYTMMGNQEKIESEGVLSIPATLNAALVGYMLYQKTNGPTTGITANTKDTNNGETQIPQQVSLFLGGRVGEHIGFEGEINVASGGGTNTNTTGNGLIRLKVPFVNDIHGITAQIIPFSTQGLGVADSFEVMNTGAVAVHAFNQTLVGGATTGGMQVISAQQYIGTATPASGAAFVASTDQFFANFAKWGASQGTGDAGSPTSNYLRVAWTPGDLIPGFDSAIGVQLWSGTSATSTIENTPAGLVPIGVFNTKATAIDAQMMGDVGGMPLLLVASYATTPGTSAADLAASGGNLFNQNPQTRKSFNIGAELGVIPNKATLQLGIRRASSGQNVFDTTGTSIAGTNASDNAYMIGATYRFVLNVRAELTYVRGSGDQYNSGIQTALGSGYFGDNMTTLDLAFGF